jgi:hypothetical protein
MGLIRAFQILKAITSLSTNLNINRQSEYYTRISYIYAMPETLIFEAFNDNDLKYYNFDNYIAG